MNPATKEIPVYDGRLASIYENIEHCIMDYDKDYISYETARAYLQRLNDSGQIKLDPDKLIARDCYGTCTRYDEHYSPSWC